MGWDAYASVKINWKGGWDKAHIEDKNLDRLFKNAVKKARGMGDGGVDCMLRLGGLDCSDCKLMLEEATGEYCFDNWDKRKVQRLNKEADWDFEYDKLLAWAYWSARVFLETCAKANLEVSFSY